MWLKVSQSLNRAALEPLARICGIFVIPNKNLTIASYYDRNDLINEVWSR
jgi:hypothetical protein